MVIIIYAINRDPAFLAAAQELAASRWHDKADRILIRNPQFYRTKEREQADVIIVRPGAALIADYRAAGAEVLEFDPEEGAPRQQPEHVEPESDTDNGPSTAQEPEPPPGLVPDPVIEIRKGRARKG